MAKELCSNCNATIADRISFCPVCSRPTPHASQAELLEWDLGQWRQHVENSVASGGRPAARVAPRSVAVADPAAAPAVFRSPSPHSPAPAVAANQPVRRARRSIPKPRLRLPAIRRQEEEDRVIVLDADHAFVYTACTSCERSDWILRTSRNEDGTYNYWCVRCSRSFKSEAKLRHGIKPFIAAGSVIGALASFSVLI